MAGTIQADFLQPQSGAGLMVLTPSGNTIATINTSGVYTSTGALAINSLGQVSNNQIVGVITSGQLAAGSTIGNYQQIITVSSNTTLTTAQSGSIVNAGGTIIISLPSPATSGLRFVVRSYSNGGAITVATPSGVFYGAQADVLSTSSLTIGSRTIVEFISDGTNWGYASSVAQGNMSASAGYQVLPSGLLLQWGQSTIGAGSSSSATISFPIAYPNNVFVVNPCFQQAGASVSGTSDLLVAGLALANFTIKRGNASNLDSFTGVAWIAIGY